MPGTPGMKMPADTKSVRQMLWRSMRIMQTFTIAGLMRTIPTEHNVKYENVQKYVTRLVKHQYVAKTPGYKGGRAGDCQSYRLINNIGPIMPVLGIGRAKNQLVSAQKKTQTDTDTYSETDTQGAAS